MLILKNDKYEFVMRDDSTYSLKSVDNPHVYNREYLFAEEETHVSSKHGIVINSQNGESYSCILLAGGGASSVHKNSALIHENKCIVAVSCYMCSLHLPTLDLEWHTQTDWATCFGVYHSLKHKCFISYGELEIARVSYSGEIIWQASGKDIFTNGFVLHDDYIETIDFNDEQYRIDVETGRCELHDV